AGTRRIARDSDAVFMEVASSHAGVVKKLLVPVGDKVREGSDILELEAAATASEAETADASSTKSKAATATQQSDTAAAEAAKPAGKTIVSEAGKMASEPPARRSEEHTS